MEQKFPRRYFASTNFSFRFFFLFLFSLSHIFHSHFSSRRKKGRKGHEGQRTTQRYSTSRIELINRISREYRLAREGDISTHMFVPSHMPSISIYISSPVLAGLSPFQKVTLLVESSLPPDEIIPSPLEEAISMRPRSFSKRLSASTLLSPDGRYKFELE